MTDEQCDLNAECELGRHRASAHPCGQRSQQPGELCRLCLAEGITDILPASGRCSQAISLEGMSLADIKALFALGDFTVDPNG